MTAVCILAAIALAAVVAHRIRRAHTAALIAYHRRVRTVDQVMDDLARWRADRRIREAATDTATCETIYALPTIPRQRKETGQ